MRVLVLTTNYPSPKVSVGLMYIHTRNKYYKKAGINVEVLNFSTDTDYVWEEINVISLNTYYLQDKSYDIYILHAPNLRNHYTFLKRNYDKMPKIIFFFHGHEVLYSNKVYPQPYKFVKRNYFKLLCENVYDRLKLKVWHSYLPKVSNKSYYVFVSEWMFNQFCKWIRLSKEDLKNNVFITYNGIGNEFEETIYQLDIEKKYDFITIRSYLDGSKYAVDVVTELAKKYPEYCFLLIGKGDFFKYFEKPNNLTWINEYYDHNKIIKALNCARCALMPTRTDAQGLMACEIASIGMPMITSDIDVCHEIFAEFQNVEYIDNNNPDKDFISKFDRLQANDIIPVDKYYYKNTIIKEINLINN